MTLIDINTLLLLILGNINPNKILHNKRTNLFDDADYYSLLVILGDLKKVTVLPNIWTEADNLLKESLKKEWKYTQSLQELANDLIEVYEPTKEVVIKAALPSLGITDTAIIKHLVGSKSKNKKLITMDSELSNFAKANGITVIDLIQIKNEKIRNS